MFCPKGYREADEKLIYSCGFLTVVDYDSNGLKQKMYLDCEITEKETFICCIRGFYASLDNSLLHLKFLVLHQIRVFSLMEISDTQSVLDKELDVDSGCFWLGESGSSVAELLKTA